MKKIFAVLFFSVFLFSTSHGQDDEFKLAKKSGTIKINISNIKVQGYDGNEILISAPEQKTEAQDERAKGLKLITASGLTDNTGLGINVQEKNDIVEVSYIDKRNVGLFTIKVPNSIMVSIITNSDVMNGKPIEVKDFTGELEISAMYNTITLDNVTGPINAKTIYGGITAKFAQSVKGPISLISLYQFTDITIPSTLKANINLSTQYGSIYADEGLNIIQSKSTMKNNDGEDVSELKDWSRATDIKGTLNGGGIDFIVKSDYGKIYLRKN